MSEEGVSHIAYFRTDGGSTKLYTQEYVDNLQNQLQQKENIIKEVREKIENTIINCDRQAENLIDDILEILDKGGNEE